MEGDYEYLCMLSNLNSLKKIKKELLLSFKKFPTFIMGLDDGERIISIAPTKKDDKIGIISAEGHMVLFADNGVRPMGK
ncbi:hypothetical protein KBB05_00670 [Patescibacteria group bacterium]|jgi:DNA gyrase/topoisomerase IV subunit A|nr:hypothetical protein [Patescibacteria group bacterium]